MLSAFSSLCENPNCRKCFSTIYSSDFLSAKYCCEKCKSEHETIELRKQKIRESLSIANMGMTKSKTKELHEIAKEASELGISYGKYVNMLRGKNTGEI